MSFVSIEFLIFLPITIFIYYVVPYRIRNIWLLSCSYIFYMSWNAKYALLMFISTMITFGCGIGIEAAGKNVYNGRKIILGLGVSLNLLMLFFFKYFNFCFITLDKILAFLNINQTNIHIDVLLPVGISFYTFQAIGYMVDVYRGDVRAEKNFIDYALFIAFFPQLVAGPIERSQRLLNQIKVKRKFSIDNYVGGMWYIVYGFFLKVVIADRIALYVDKVYENIDRYQGLYIIVATILFSIQIYCDFYGYTTIARGTAQMFGIKLMDNFRAPYLALSVTDFWRRWHISLTSWFRDYLYIPLGGNRKGRARKYINTLLVFLCSGLWHGAAWGYVIWGGLNGLYLILEEVSLPIRQFLYNKFEMKKAYISHKLIKMGITFMAVNFTWIFFRSADISKSLYAIRSAFSNFNLEILFAGSISDMWISYGEMFFLGLSFLVVLFVDYMKSKNISILDCILQQGLWFRCFLFTSLLITVLLLGIYGGEYDASKFIYFQF